MPRKIIIDTDPGVDDAMAILFALQSPELNVVGLTTVFGNVEVDLATANALRLVEFAGRSEIPVARGAEKPLELPFAGPADFVHGQDGLGNTNLAAPAGRAVDATAAEFIVETVMANPGEITLVPIGPLTNIALALELEPRIAGAVAEVVLMGGAATVNGNVNPAAEANFYNDPHAADRVFLADWEVAMVGLDVTVEVLMDEPYLDSLRSSAAGDFIYRISRFYHAFHQRVHGISALHTHDPSAIAYLIDRSLFAFERGPIRVAIEGVARGHVIWDCRADWPSENDWTGLRAANVCVRVDSQQMLALFKERIRG